MPQLRGIIRTPLFREHGFPKDDAGITLGVETAREKGAGVRCPWRREHRKRGVARTLAVLRGGAAMAARARVGNRGPVRGNGAVAAVNVGTVPRPRADLRGRRGRPLRASVSPTVSSS